MATTALPTVFSIIAFHAPMLITIGMIVMELVRRDGAPLHKSLAVAAVRIVQNPLLWGVALGLIGNRFGLVLPEPGTAFFDDDVGGRAAGRAVRAGRRAQRISRVGELAAGERDERCSSSSSIRSSPMC